MKTRLLASQLLHFSRWTAATREALQSQQPWEEPFLLIWIWTSPPSSLHTQRVHVMWLLTGTFALRFCSCFYSLIALFTCIVVKFGVGLTCPEAKSKSLKSRFYSLTFVAHKNVLAWLSLLNSQHYVDVCCASQSCCVVVSCCNREAPHGPKAQKVLFGRRQQQCRFSYPSLEWRKEQHIILSALHWVKMVLNFWEAGWPWPGPCLQGRCWVCGDGGIVVVPFDCWHSAAVHFDLRGQRVADEHESTGVPPQAPTLVRDEWCFISGAADEFRCCAE